MAPGMSSLKMIEAAARTTVRRSAECWTMLRAATARLSAVELNLIALYALGVIGFRKFRIIGVSPICRFMGVLLVGPVAAVQSSQPASHFYQVGPGRSLQSLQEICGSAGPGDVVEVEGDHRYPGGISFVRPGTSEAPIVIRGVKVNGRRPILAGGRDVVHFNASHYVMEGFEILEGERLGVRHHASDITIRDCVIHDCPNGIMSADHDSGNLKVEFCEVYHCGRGDSAHQLYLSTDEEKCPGSAVQVRCCYIHEGTGGNNIKSRAERTVLYANWISGAYYHNLDLIGADPVSGVSADRAREDGDVVGNVLIATRFGRNVRVGGDGTGQSNGRYRFLNNTFIHRFARPQSHLQARFGVESVEMHNNIFYLASGAVFDDSKAEWLGGVRRVGGTANWVHRFAQAVPAEWTRTITGLDPGLTDLESGLLRPLPGSLLIGAGILEPRSPPGAPFLNPMPTAAHHPPEARLLPVGTVEVRQDHPPDIGAFGHEFRAAGPDEFH